MDGPWRLLGSNQEKNSNMFDPYHEINKQIRRLHNQLRVNPQSFAHLAQQRLVHFQDNVYFSSEMQNMGIMTLEGSNAVMDLLTHLQACPATPELRPSLALQMAAYYHAQDMSSNPNLVFEHTGSNGTNAEERVSLFGKWQGHLIEQIIFGYSSATEILVNMLIDDGLQSRANRRNMLNKGLGYMGIGICPHPLFRYVCVILYAKHVQDQAALVQDQVAQQLASKELQGYQEG